VLQVFRLLALLRQVFQVAFLHLALLHLAWLHRVMVGLATPFPDITQVVASCWMKQVLL
jgi:hypothetical protein